jgi:uncharacterized protein YjbI with pentapeptide repeats
VIEMRRATRSTSSVCDDPACLHVAPPRISDRSSDTLATDDGVLEVERTRVAGSKSAGFRADRASVEDAVLEACDLSNGEVTRGSFTRVAFVECKMTGFVFGEGVRFDDVTFDRCILDDALFDGAELVRVAFHGCRMTGVGLRATRGEGVAFEGCDLSKADLSGMTIARGSSLRLHACGLAGVAIDARIVASSIVDADAARAIVSALGARVSEAPLRRSCERPTRAHRE